MTLELRVVRPRVAVDLSALPDIKSFSHALVKCAEACGSQDKGVAADTGIDNALWTRIKQNDAGVKGEWLDKLMDACGNELPLLWLLYSRGYDPSSLRKRESETEKRARLAEERSAALEAKLELAYEIMGRVKAA